MKNIPFKITCATALGLAMAAGAPEARAERHGYYDGRMTAAYYSDPYRRDSRYDDRYGDARVIRCESRDRRTVFCGDGIGGNARLVQQVSDARCIRGSTWGVDRGRLWVSRGCRGHFEISGDRYGSRYDDRYDDRRENRYGNAYGGGGYGGGRMLRCESQDGRYNFCGSIGSGRVQMQRQLSSSRCVLNSTWGVRNGGVWVDRGCRAEFVVY